MMPKIKSTGLVVDQLEALNNKYVLSNGFLGVSGIMDELKQEDNAHLKVNTLLKKDRTGEYYLSVFNPLCTSVKAAKIDLHPLQLQPKFHEQELDMDNGLYSRTTIYEVNDVEIKIHSERFVDQKNRNFIYSKYIIYVDKPIDLEITHGFDLERVDKYPDDFTDVVFETDGDLSLQAIAKESDKPLYIVYGFDKNFKNRHRHSKIKHQENYLIKAEPDREYEIIKYVGISTDKRKDFEYLKKVLRRSQRIGYGELLLNNQNYWERLWKNSRVYIFNNDLVDRYNQYNQFQLISHRPLNESMRCSRYGMTNRPIDETFVNEMYMFKYYLNTDYKQARRWLVARIRGLEEAKANAQRLKKQGALYTDRSDNLYINAMIVINLMEYIERTLDKSLLALGGVSMALEISKFYLDYITPNHKKTNYQVLNVKSLDGELTDIDNNALLNYLIKDCLGKCANIVAMAKVENRKDVEEFLRANQYDVLINEIREVKKKLYLQQPNVNNLIQIFDKYFKTEEKLRFPDVLNLFLLYPEDFKELVKEENFAYYNKLTNTNGYGAFILAFLGITHGFEREANKYFKQFMALNIYDNANKYNHVQDTLDLGLSACLYLHIVYGFAGLRHDRYLMTADSYIPNDIRRLEFKIKVAKNIASVKIKRNSAIIEWNEYITTSTNEIN
ncbi:MAG: hypothetical protein CVV60_03550 [Tenericutes bacterium HGW-Tenericutes-5]|jgi:trehalose/maltose hydrolase-like predicted phosphorylase|nr:MAG: hypothetical protein CVV60_03550 [Tenericutes bacterium HGW-Tenericutes-5]